jgi:hypothetical protein
MKGNEMTTKTREELVKVLRDALHSWNVAGETTMTSGGDKVRALFGSRWEAVEDAQASLEAYDNVGKINIWRRK